MAPGRIPVLIAALALGACAVYPPDRDTTQPDKIKKAMLVCADGSQKWPDCSKGAVPAEWYFRPTVIKAPYEAWWTFEGEQGSTYRISWEITENLLLAYRTYTDLKGGNADVVHASGHAGEPIAAWAISDHFDVWHQYNPATGEQLPVLYEAKEKPWYEREYVRVDWTRNLVDGYGFFMGSKLTQILEEGALKVEAADVQANDPSDPDYRILTDNYLDVVARETVTPMVLDTPSGWSSYFYPGAPVSQVDYRFSFMRATPRDYAPLYYPDPMFEKFGYFRLERDTYDPLRGVTDFKDYFMERWNLWQKVHSAKTCSAHAECGGGADKGVTCDLQRRDAQGLGRCTLPYAERGVKPIVYFLSPDFPEDRYLSASCMIAQGWNVAFKQVLSKLLGKGYAAPALDDAFAKTCTLNGFREPPAGSPEFDPAKHDAFILKRATKTCDDQGREGMGDRWCQRAGDLRYSMIYYSKAPSLGSPLGYGPVADDPETGEILQGNAFVYGAALDSYRAFVADNFDLATGELGELDMTTGESIRQYYQNLSGNVFPPTGPVPGFMPKDLESLKERLQGLKDKAESMQRMSPKARTPYLGAFKGTSVEALLTDNAEFKNSFGLDVRVPMDERMLDQVSPLRAGSLRQSEKIRKLDALLGDSRHCVYRPNEYTDATVNFLVNKYARQGLDRKTTIDRVMEAVYRGVTEHEVGHTVGLRHNFEASFDRDNYFDAYYPIVHDPAHADPDPVQFSEKNPKALPLTPTEYQQFDAARTVKRHERDELGIKLHQYSSIMDYGGQFYSDLRGLGKYDKAAVKFGYGSLVEVFDGPPDEANGRANRLDKVWYPGGEPCGAAGTLRNSDCPYAGAGQTCQPGPKADRGVCSGFDQDAARNASSYTPVKYRFCSDERTDDRPFCNRFDEGASSLEIVENMIEMYDRLYVFNNFRRYRAGFNTWNYYNRIWGRYFYTMAKQYSSLLYQLYYNQSAVLSTGAGSFSDMLAAAVKAMNFFGRVLMTPDVGAYRSRPLDVVDGHQRFIYERFSGDCNAAGTGDLKACLGVGKHYWSVWETGYYGQIERQSRVGVFLDKIFAIEALTNRNWGNPNAIDESYPLSFYDGFKGEMLNLFSGIISQDLARYAPTIVDVTTPAGHEKGVQYRDIWTGSFFGASSADLSYNSSPLVHYPGSVDSDTRYAGSDLLNPEGFSTFVRLYALIYSMQFWPSVYDQTYNDYMQLYSFGGPEVRFPADGREVIAYESPRRKKIYMAVQTPDKKSIIFPLVAQAAQIKDDYDRFRSMTPAQADAEGLKALYSGPGQACSYRNVTTNEECRQALVDRQANELDDRESFLNLVVELRHALGLTF